MEVENVESRQKVIQKLGSLPLESPATQEPVAPVVTARAGADLWEWVSRQQGDVLEDMGPA